MLHSRNRVSKRPLPLEANLKIEEFECLLEELLESSRILQVTLYDEIFADDKLNEGCSVYARDCQLSKPLSSSSSDSTGIVK